MIALAVAVFTASVLGSMHCAGMCGAFVAFAVGLDATPTAAMKARLQAAYHLGRLIVYTILGAVAGSLGMAFDLAGESLGVQRAAVAVSGAAMVAFGSIAILRLNGVQLPSAPVPGLLRNAAAAALSHALNCPPLLRALLTGLFTTLLPCGWLYAFVITAAGSGSAPRGAAIMAFFWLGTLPALIALGGGVQALAARLGSLGRRVPLITAALIVVVGLFNVFDRGSLVSAAMPTAVTGDASIARLHDLDSREAPCCHDHPRR